MVGGKVLLREALPDLARWIEAGLRQQERSELAKSVVSLRIHSCDYKSDHASIFTVTEAQADGLMYRRDRERIWLGRVHGLPRRQWAVTLEVIDDSIYHIGLSHPGILRPLLRRLCGR
jgi:hypothetical protein